MNGPKTLPSARTFNGREPWGEGHPDREVPRQKIRTLLSGRAGSPERAKEVGIRRRGKLRDTALGQDRVGRDTALDTVGRYTRIVYGGTRYLQKL